MEKTIRQELFATEPLEILEEAFDRHHGVFLDKDTSLLPTLETVTSEIASTSIAAGTVSIVAYVEHVILYLEVLGGHIAGEEVGDVDWARSGSGSTG